MTTDFPLFMQNKEWYYYDWDEHKCKLTEHAPPEAHQSYEDYYANYGKPDKDGMIILA